MPLLRYNLVRLISKLWMSPEAWCIMRMHCNSLTFDMNLPPLWCEGSACCAIKYLPFPQQQHMPCRSLGKTGKKVNSIAQLLIIGIVISARSQLNNIQMSMLSESRTREATAQFLASLREISTQIINYYFSDKQDPRPFTLKRHCIDLYNFVFERCTAKPSQEEAMVALFRSVLEKHLSAHLELLINSIETMTLIEVFNRTWESYATFTFLLAKRFFPYLNRYYLPANGDETLNKIGIRVFISVCLSENFLKFYFPAYSEGLARIRSTRNINHSELLKFSESMAIINNPKLFNTIKDIYMMTAVKDYRKLFDQYCNREPTRYLSMVINQRYFEKVLIKKCICFTPSESEALEQLFELELVKKYTHFFCNQPNGFAFMLKAKKVNQLGLVCDVYSRQTGYHDLKAAVHDFIIREAAERFEKSATPSSSNQFVCSFYNFYTEYSTLLNRTFPKVTDIQNGFKSAIEKVLATFDRITQDLYKVTRAHLDSGTFEDVSQKVVTIFEKLPYKDEFITLYRSSLEKKIITGTVIYLIEKKFIQTVNKICGNEATGDLDKILEDCIESMPKDLVTNRQNFNVKVVSLHYWEKKFEDQVSLNLTLVEPLLSTWRTFQASYLKLFPKRSLILLPYETKMVLRVRAHSRENTIKCNLIQACIIHFVANQGSVREEAIISSLTLERTFLHRFLEEFPSIVVEVEPGHYRFNWELETTDQVLDLDGKVEEGKKVTRHVKQDREILVQYSIARILKRAKEIEFEELVHRVTHDIKLFKPHPALIKTALEALKKKEIVQQLSDGKIVYKD